MKNIFLVINKEKIYAYIVSVLTIVTLFFMSGMINSSFNDAEVSSSKVIEKNTREEINKSVENNIEDNEVSIDNITNNM